MANRFAGLDPTWAHLPTPAPTHAAASHCCSFPAAAFENKALTSALRASMAPAHAYAYAAAAAASPFSSPATPSSSTTSSASELLSSGHDAPAPSSGPAGRPPARALKGPKAGRVSKRKPRPLRRPQTTYITADPANFRRMVQEVTGLPARVPAGPPSSVAPERTAAAAAPSWTLAPSFVLPTLDTSAFLLDRAAPAPEVKSSSRGYAPAATAPTAAAAGNDDPLALLVQMEAMIDFPTLESWGII
ncbi:calmodulin-binding protein 25-like [Panicum virgatum]|uniref:VQ domain-containing protein n=1 Tax=Panicum virgatum TaxID=38727 RepID=A0A8T0RRT1_PANVG|nr:calmodulin-binding protein 25-like [Panicum virgatum]KAG2588030.1 hypothetical protein PVAP13_5NG191600 [Panicum virgatum]